MGFTVIACMRPDRGIGAAGKLPWHNDSELAHFRRHIKDQIIIVGRKTYETLPPLPVGRVIVIGQRNIWAGPHEPLYNAWATNMESAYLIATEMQKETGKEIFVIGGQRTYASAILHPGCDRILLSVLETDQGAVPCDTFMPLIPTTSFAAPVSRPHAQDNNTFTVLEYVRASEERQYLDLVRELLCFAPSRSSRTMINTNASFGHKMVFNLRGGVVPLLSTRRIYWTGLVGELFWMLHGKTDVSELSAKGIKIWDGNTRRAFLDGRGLQRLPEGDIGAGYGFQWRHFGGKYNTCKETYDASVGVDQIRACLDLIRNDSTDRRILFTAWNPSALSEMALPPCHLLCQFFVSDGELSAQVYQRSADVALGVPFNIASYALLVHLFANACGLQPGTLHFVFGDTHIYNNHRAAMKVLITRTPQLRWPKVAITKQLDPTNVDSWRSEDVVLTDYSPNIEPLPAMPMAV